MELKLKDLVSTRLGTLPKEFLLQVTTNGGRPIEGVGSCSHITARSHISNLGPRKMFDDSFLGPCCARALDSF